MPRPSLPVKPSAEDPYAAGQYAYGKWEATPTPVTDKIFAEVDLPVRYDSSVNTPENIEKATKAYPILWSKFSEQGLAHPKDARRPGEQFDYIATAYAFKDAEKIAQLARYGASKQSVLSGLRSEGAAFIRRDARLKKEDESDLLGLYRKPAAPEKDLIEFPSREKELEGLFGGRSRKSRKARGRKTRATRKRRTIRRRS